MSAALKAPNAMRIFNGGDDACHKPCQCRGPDAPSDLRNSKKAAPTGKVLVDRETASASPARA
ncbi:MAG: hypothetical protein NXI03_08120 [Alphaproteobacteria bacterium]|nr:hypothetical protein [Ponticoccus sp. SC6-36]MCR9267523.1 hypothetical protein [Alphaproteobacteria bacterium]